MGTSGKQVTYDYNNRPTNVVFGGQTTGYTYGPDGARQTKTVGGVETFYAGMGEIRDLGGPTSRSFFNPTRISGSRMLAARGRLSAPSTATTSAASA